MPARTVPLAVIYDFDGALAPGNMLYRQFIPDIGMTAADFWREVDALSDENHADRILPYMYVMLEKAKSAGRPVRREDLFAMGDSETDVPCFRLVKDLGGLSIAVYPPEYAPPAGGVPSDNPAQQRAERYREEGRVSCGVPADYSQNGELDNAVKSYVNLLAL